MTVSRRFCMSKRHYTLPDLPTVCPYCGEFLSEPQAFEQITTAYLKLVACNSSECGNVLFSVAASRDHVSGARVWIVNEL